MTPKDFFEFAKKNNAKMVDLKFVDFLGTWQHCSYPIDTWDESTFVDGVGFDGSSIRGWQDIHMSDMLAIPDPATLVIDPFFKEPTVSVIADIVDYDETRTGKRRETTYSGINALLTKPAISIANWLFLRIINDFGFDSFQTTQSSSTQMGIMIGFSLIPAIFLIFSSIVMLFYPLDGSEWLAQKAELIKIHEKKEIDYLNYLEDKKRSVKRGVL